MGTPMMPSVSSILALVRCIGTTIDDTLGIMGVPICTEAALEPRLQVRDVVDGQTSTAQAACSDNESPAGLFVDDDVVRLAEIRRAIVRLVGRGRRAGATSEARQVEHLHA